MKLLSAWIFLFILILFSFYYINMNLEKTVGVSELINTSTTKDKKNYSAKNVDNEDDIISFDLLKESEIFVLSGNYTSKNEKDKKEIILEINRPNKDVILVLNSKDETTWNIKVSDNTRISLIIYASNNKVLSREKIYKYKKELELDLDMKSIKFVELLKYINKMTQKEKIDYFYSKDILENNIIIDQILNNPEQSLRYLFASEAKVNFKFELISKSYEFVPFTLQGPMNIKDHDVEIRSNVVSSPNKNKIYEIINNGIKIINTNTRKETSKVIPILKKSPNLKGIAYDDLGDMVYVVNKFGKFYIFDADEGKWKSIRKYIDDFSINSISYDTFNNTFISSSWDENKLILFDQNGNFAKEYSLEDKLLGFNYHYKTNEEIPKLHIVPNGDNLAIVLIDKIVQKIWLFDKLTKKATLTYNYMQEN